MHRLQPVLPEGFADLLIEVSDAAVLLVLPDDGVRNLKPERFPGAPGDSQDRRPPDLAPKTLPDHVIPADRGAMNAALASARGGASTSLEAETLSGRRFRARLAPLPATLARSLPAGTVLVIARDITEERSTREALEGRDRLYSALVKATSEIVWRFDAVNGLATRQGWSEFTGARLPASDAFGWLNAVHSEDRPAVLARIEPALTDQKAYRVEYRLRHHAGGWRWVEDHAVPTFDAEGRLTDWIGIVTDIHDRKTAEQRLRASEERLRLAVEATGLGAWDVDLQTGARTWSAELRAMLGLPRDCPATQAILLDRVHPDDRATVAAFGLAQGHGEGDHHAISFRIFRADTGAMRWIRSQGRNLHDESGAPIRRIGAFQDITQTHETRHALRLALRRFEALITATSEVVWYANADQTAGGGTGWSDFTGEPHEQADGWGWLTFVHPDDRPRTEANCRAAVAAGQTYTNEYRLKHHSGQWRWVNDRVVPLLDDSGAVYEWVGIISDIHDRKTAEQAIWAAAHTDDLTGLANRTLFQRRLEEAVAEAGREGQPVAIMMIDLDRFKEVNDSLGHDAGDAVLRTVSNRLRRTVPTSSTIARLGGDEFGVILTGPTVMATATIAEALLAALRQPLTHEAREVDCSATIGFAIADRSGADPSTLLKNADLALYAAKSAGRGQAIAFAPAMRADLDRRLAVLRNAKDALARDAIIPFYQPQVSLSTGEVVGFEALLRWSDGNGLRSPGELAEAFLDQELSTRIGHTMLEKVVADMQVWRDLGLGFGRVAINVAAPEFLQPTFVQGLLGQLSAARLETRVLELEVTESVLLEDGAVHVAEALKALDAAGVAISLDDFGTGYASLTHLKKFPVSWLKIDRSFVSNLETDRDSAAIVQAVLGMARNIGIRVVAEGVETAWQYDFLERNACDVVQGYLIAKPMAASRVPHFLRTWHQPEAKTVLPHLAS